MLSVGLSVAMSSRVVPALGKPGSLSVMTAAQHEEYPGKRSVFDDPAATGPGSVDNEGSEGESEEAAQQAAMAAAKAAWDAIPDLEPLEGKVVLTKAAWGRGGRVSGVPSRSASPMVSPIKMGSRRTSRTNVWVSVGRRASTRANEHGR